MPYTTGGVKEFSSQTYSAGGYGVEPKKKNPKKKRRHKKRPFYRRPRKIKRYIRRGLKLKKIYDRYKPRRPNNKEYIRNKRLRHFLGHKLVSQRYRKYWRSRMPYNSKSRMAREIVGLILAGLGKSPYETLPK